MLKQIKEAVDFLNLKAKIDSGIEIGIILGTGLGGLVKEIDILYSIDYKEIPHFPISTVEGHSGRLIIGNLGGKRIVAMQGRFHFYEGYSMQKETFPVRVMKAIGVSNLLISNASGGVNPAFQIGDLMIINDHINLIPNPLIGKNIDDLGTRFPDMSKPYDLNLIRIAEKTAKENEILIRKGTYVAVTGPCLETPAEYKMVRIIGGDAVGMSTVPEVIVARHMGMSCFAISVITDMGVEGRIKEVSHEEIQVVAETTEPYLTVIMKELIKKI